mgnify:CR=1 FL=1|jgi:hypothetical protein
MESTQELIKKLKETQRDLQWQYDMELYRLENNLKKKEKAIDDLNTSLFKITQENMEKDKIIEALEEQVKQMNIKTDLEKRVADLEERLKTKENTEEKLEVGKWYHTTDFTKEELEKLLPKETTILVEKKVLYENIGTTPPTETKKTTVKRITTANFSEITLIEIDTGDFLKEWFKIIKE